MLTNKNKPQFRYMQMLLQAVAVSIMLIPGAMAANTPNVIHPEAEELEANSGTYLPGLGELMLSGVQPRHIKLWLAGKEKNWSLASYELDELKEALEDVVHFQSNWNHLPIGDMEKAMMTDPMQALAETIQAGDEVGFTRAYSRLTQACNNCHRGADRRYLVIQIPGNSPYPDQDFHPEKE